jgi:hypothetical protein
MESQHESKQPFIGADRMKRKAGECGLLNYLSRNNHHAASLL